MIATTLRMMTGALLGGASAVFALTQGDLPFYTKSELGQIVYTKAEVDKMMLAVKATGEIPVESYPRATLDRVFDRFEAELNDQREKLRRVPRIKTYAAKNDQATHLFYNERTIPGFTIQAEVAEPGVALIDFHCDVEHRNLVKGVIGVGARIWYRHAARREDLAQARMRPVPGAVTGTNITNIEHHYGQLPISAVLPLETGWYQFEVRIGSHSSLAPRADGLAQINPGSKGDAYNKLRVVVVEGAEVGGMIGMERVDSAVNPRTY